jgi:hypothetical protein
MGVSFAPELWRGRETELVHEIAAGKPLILAARVNRKSLGHAVVVTGIQFGVIWPEEHISSYGDGFGTVSPHTVVFDSLQILDPAGTLADSSRTIPASELYGSVRAVIRVP